MINRGVSKSHDLEAIVKNALICFGHMNIKI